MNGKKVVGKMVVFLSVLGVKVSIDRAVRTFVFCVFGSLLHRATSENGNPYLHGTVHNTDFD